MRASDIEPSGGSSGDEGETEPAEGKAKGRRVTKNAARELLRKVIVPSFGQPMPQGGLQLCSQSRQALFEVSLRCAGFRQSLFMTVHCRGVSPYTTSGRSTREQACGSETPARLLDVVASKPGPTLGP